MRQPSPVALGGFLEALAEVGRREIEDRLAVLRHQRVEIDEVREALRHPVGDAGHDHAAVALAGQDHIVQVLIAKQVDDVLDVGLQADLRRRQVRSLAVAGEGRPNTSWPRACSSEATSRHSQPPPNAP